MSDAMREAIARALLPHAYVSPFRCSCGWGVVRKLADESLESLFAQHQADAVLAVVRGVDADQWEQVGWSYEYPQQERVYLSYDRPSEVIQAFKVAPVYRRVVPVVPSPAPCEHCGSTPCCDPVVASPDRCPTCGSDDPLVRILTTFVSIGGTSACRNRWHPGVKNDPWHRVPSTEGDQ